MDSFGKMSMEGRFKCQLVLKNILCIYSMF